MKKRFLIFTILLLLIAGSSMMVYAEEYTGDEGWTVKFTGKKMESNFKSSDLSDAILAMQPGDSMTIDLRLENSSDFTTDWYMTNEVISSLEDSQDVAEGGAYAYILTYTDSDGQVTELYNSDNVGGEKDSAVGEGLHEATDSLEDYLYLDRLGAGKAGTVSLTVSLDGETQGNAYQDTLADLQMNFAVETVEPEEESVDREITRQNTVTERVDNEIERQVDTEVERQVDTQKETTSSRTQESGNSYVIRTGDNYDMVPWCIASLVSGIVLLVLAVIRYKRSRKGRSS